MFRPHIFVSYAHDDRRWFEKNSLMPRLIKSLEYLDKAEVWYDRRRLAGGDPWRQEIEDAIDRAHVAVLLVSTYFIVSDFIRDVELPRISERAKKGELVIIPILVGHCDWRRLEVLKGPQMIPGEPTPLVEYRESESKWEKVQHDILNDIERQINKLQLRPEPDQDRTAESPTLSQEPLGPSATTATTGEAPLAGKLPASQRSEALLVPGDSTLLGAQPARSVRTSTTNQGLAQETSRSAERSGISESQTLTSGKIRSLIEIETLSTPELYSYDLEFSKRGTCLAASTLGAVYVWDVASWDRIRLFKGHTGQVGEIHFDESGRLLLSAADDSSAILWDVHDGHEVTRFLDEEQEKYSIHSAIAPDGKLVATSMSEKVTATPEDMSVKIREVASGRLLVTLHEGRSPSGTVFGLSFNSSGDSIAFSRGKHVKIFDVSTGRPRHTILTPNYVYSTAFSSSGKYLVTGGAGGYVIVWDAVSGKLLRSKSHAAQVETVAFAAEDDLVFSADRQGHAIISDRESLSTVASFQADEESQSAAISVDACLVAVAQPHRILILELQ